MFSQIYQYNTPSCEEKKTPPFNELILSWNGLRPKNGKWTFWVSLKEGEWLKIAEWGSSGQRSFNSVGQFSSTYQDVATPKDGYCHSFKIKVEGDELIRLHSLYVCISNLQNHEVAIPENLPPVILSNMPRRSQMLLNHPRHRDLCSPTSTTNAINYLVGHSKLDPLLFASQSFDQEFNIYGNWILNAAEAYTHLEGRFGCRIERLANFTALHSKLLQGLPVVVSVKGPIPGAPLPYNFGHLICVIGYENGKVHCIDPAFPKDESTYTSYPLKDFLKAWALRYNLAYVFHVLPL